MVLPGRVAQAFAPLGFAILLEHMGSDALLVTAGLGLASFAALTCIRIRKP
jgi:hypothetical protein